MNHFIRAKFPCETFHLFENIEVIDFEYREDMPMFFMTVDDNNRFDPKGRPVLVVNPNAEIYSMDLPLDLYLGMIVHEKTHYQQYLDNRLRFTEDSTIDAVKVIWEGIEYANELIDLDQYLNQPWEREAFEAQGHFIDQYRSDVPGTWYTNYVKMIKGL
jgi:hypothetical protein